jgi:rhamnosyltransferase
MNIYAGIVTYNPDINRLKSNIEGIIGQVDKLVIYDNHSDNIKDIIPLCKQYSNRIYVECSETNRGIAVAFNRIMDYSIRNDAQWVVLLDQDTICPNDMVNEYLKYIDVENIAIIAPVLIDRRRANSDIDKYGTAKHVIKVESSGSMINVSAYRKIGIFEEELFIDMVDYEYCMRARINGYGILKLTNVFLDQEFGNVKPSRLRNFYHRLYNITGTLFFKHLEYIPVFSTDRVIYSYRNWVYCLKKYRLYSRKIKCKYQIIVSGLINYVRTGFSWTYLKAYIRGIREGMKMQPKVYRTDNIRQIDLM